mmetsp:Transcript_73955/g.186396  ORF Transcript_73955/g.186396 Transcript_73955/m.186396 type:complete len:233 (+) Transcript_73955:413-1111(+)
MAWRHLREPDGHQNPNIGKTAVTITCRIQHGQQVLLHGVRAPDWFPQVAIVVCQLANASRKQIAVVTFGRRTHLVSYRLQLNSWGQELVGQQTVPSNFIDRRVILRGPFQTVADVADVRDELDLGPTSAEWPPTELPDRRSQRGRRWRKPADGAGHREDFGALGVAEGAEEDLGASVAIVQVVMARMRDLGYHASCEAGHCQVLLLLNLGLGLKSMQASEKEPSALLAFDQM